MADKFNKFTNEQISALRLLYDKGLIMPLLMVLYTTIDILGYVTGFGFITFVKKYMQEDLEEITPRDLWGGRCAILHTGSPKSEHSEKGKARQIMYSWGKADFNVLKKIINDSQKRKCLVGIKLETLINSLIFGIQRLKKEIKTNTNLYRVCSKKIKEFYCDNRV